MKRMALLGVLLILLGVTYTYKEDLVIFLHKYLFNSGKIVSPPEKNEYYRDYDFDFVQNTSSFSPEDRQDILNIFYTIINSGVSEFSFYCSDSYKSCLNDVKYIANDQTILSDINNFVHPYNGFKHIETQYDSLGQVTVNVTKTYTKQKIKEINKKIKEIENEIAVEDAPDLDNIKMIHDYIINNSKYDSNRSDNNVLDYESDNAYGPLLQGFGLCGGYTDAMELFLEDMNIKSYKISSENHVWNAVYLDDKWSHLDLTWDDPVTSDHSDVLDYSFFMIDTLKLKSLEDSQHIYNQEIYSELKEA